MPEENEPIPSTHLIPDKETAAGDTPQAHAETNPHDLPAGPPGRPAAEQKAEEEPTADRARTPRGAAERHASIEDAMSDENEPIPSTHLIPDNETAAGDTPEAHDEINPHDLPAGHPGRPAAEQKAEEEPSDDGARTTRGDEDRLRAAPERDERLERGG